jgi:U4/U6.U5 tri-snRNP-associated protein 3
LSAPASQKVTPPRTDEEGEAEEGEEMDVLNGEDEDMLAAMGMTGFGTTKVIFLKFPTVFFSLQPTFFQGQHVEGNQDGGANVKKSRTWRQYMNRYVHPAEARHRNSA